MIQKAFKLLKKCNVEPLKRKIDSIRGLDFHSIIEPEQVGLDPSIVFRSSASGNKYLEAVLKDLHITRSDSIIDIGCGKGSALRTMSKFPFSKIDGIELSEHIVAIANKNIRTLNIKRITIFNQNATVFGRFTDYNYVYLYNPFPSQIMQKVLKNILDSLQQNPRKFVIIYDNPTCNEDILNTGIFNIVAQYPDKWKNEIYVYNFNPAK